jgi:hypothetical protein
MCEPMEDEGNLRMRLHRIGLDCQSQSSPSFEPQTTSPVIASTYMAAVMRGFHVMHCHGSTITVFKNEHHDDMNETVGTLYSAQAVYMYTQ